MRIIVPDGVHNSILRVLLDGRLLLLLVLLPHFEAKDGIGTISELPTNCRNEPSIGLEVSSAAYFALYVTLLLLQ